MAPDERRQRLVSVDDLHASKRYDGSEPCSDFDISVASLKSTRRRTNGRQPEPAEQVGCVHGDPAVRVINMADAFCTDYRLQLLTNDVMKQR